MKKILVINGPNLNMLGVREPDLYGKQDFKALCKYIKICAKELGCKVQLYQSNHEGDLVTAIQKAYGKKDGIVINPGAYTHTSVAILDVVKACGVPTVEVHLTDISSREEFRQISYISSACQARFLGLGFEGYKKALEFICEH